MAQDYGDWVPTIGVECHVQLATKTKLFTPISNDARQAEPNTCVGPLCFGLPGTLPVLNQQAVSLAIKAGLALNAEIAHETRFDRKHYFYPDLPLGYQISQFDKPIVGQGQISFPVQDSEYTVRIQRAHLEADAGKLVHPEGADYSLVDLNRAGTPLLEIVSEADMHTPIQVKQYCKDLYLRMLHAGVSDCDLYHGNIRFDVNVSVSRDDQLGTRTETKNINSFKNVQRAVTYEIKRQIEVLQSGGKIVQETRGWDEAKQKTVSQRTKEDAHDYRYMPDPDLPPVMIEANEVDQIRASMPPSIDDLRRKFSELKIGSKQISDLLDIPQACWVVNDVASSSEAQAVMIANWTLSVLSADSQGQKFNWDDLALSQDNLRKLAEMVEDQLISATAAKELVGEVAGNNLDPQKLAKTKGLLQISDLTELEKIVDEVIATNPDQASEAKREPKLIGYLVGQAMKASQGRANPKLLNQFFVKKLK